jgi:acyl-CoA reductase-like NAD-dependent aldehyde dehydrogenase
VTSHEYSSFYIGGRWVPARSDRVRDVVSPRSERRIGSVPLASAADIDAAVAAARHAFDETDWARRTPAERGELCARLADGIAARSDELALLFTEAPC